MICNKCGKEIPDASTTCPECGAALTDIDDATPVDASTPEAPAAPEPPEAPTAPEAPAAPAAPDAPTPPPAPGAESDATPGVVPPVPVAPGAPEPPASVPGAPVSQTDVKPAPQPYTPDSTDALSVASLVCSIVGVIFLPFIGTILGIVFGAIAVKRNAHETSNYKLALAGIIVGIVGLALYVLICSCVVGLGIMGAGASTTGTF